MDIAITEAQTEIAIRLVVAAVAGMVIGIERELRDQAAGLRTHMLVAVGACLFTIVGVYGFGSDSDPARVAAQVVTGIGFLGAGAIIREGVSVRGLTTAASLWVVAAAGTAVGIGLYWATGVATVVTLLSLWTLRPFRRRLRNRGDSSHPEGYTAP